MSAPRIEDIRPWDLGGDWWVLSAREARERYAADHDVDVPSCQAHTGTWIANIIHTGRCDHDRVIVRGVVYAAMTQDEAATKGESPDQP